MSGEEAVVSRVKNQHRDTPTSSHMTLEWLICTTLLLAVGMLVVKAVGIAQYALAILRYPFQWDDAEGVILAEASLIAHGTNPFVFQHSPSPHFYAGPYTPLYTLMNAIGIAYGGPTFKIGRMIQLSATLAVAGWLGWAVTRTAKRRLAWLIGVWIGILFATMHLVAVWSVLVRPDMTALLWNLVGLSMLHMWWEGTGRAPWDTAQRLSGKDLGLLACGAACFALGWWTKQTCIAVPLAFIVHLFFRHAKGAILLASLYGAMILVPFGMLTLLTSGGFAQKTLAYQGSWNWYAYRRIAEPFIERYGLLLAIAVIAAINGCVCRRIPFSTWWVLFSTLLSFGAGTSGGNHNHFVEVLAASCLIVGQSAVAGLRHLNGSGSRRKNVRIGGPLIVGVALLTGVAVHEHEGNRGWLAYEYRQPTAAERIGYAQVASYLANSPGPVYSDNVGILIVAAQAVNVTDPFTMATEVRLGRWDDRLLVDDITNERYRLIALRVNVADVAADRPPTDETPGIISAILAHYRLVENNVLKIYAPICEPPPAP